MQLRSPRPGPPGRGLGLKGPLEYPRFPDMDMNVHMDVMDVDLDANVDADVVVSSPGRVYGLMRPVSVERA